VALEMDLLESQEHHRRPLAESTTARLRDLLDRKTEQKG
jgi:hypothetical protein